MAGTGHEQSAAAGGSPDQDRAWDLLGSRRRAVVPLGPLEQFADRVMVYARPTQVANVLPLLSPRRGGVVIAGPGEHGFGPSVAALRRENANTPFFLDPAYYEHYTATPQQPFYLPPDRLECSTLAGLCDDQRAAGAALAVTSTGYIPAGATDTLKAVLAEVAALDRTDVLTMLPLDVSLVDQGYFDQTYAIITEAQLPVALVLVAQFDPVDQSRHIVPNLRRLAAAVPLLPVRTDLNALDLVAHGAICGAIGLSGTTRHAVPAGEQSRSSKRSRGPGLPPHVLVTDLLSWWRNDKLAEQFGARQSIAPRCDCRVCGSSQRLTRFTGRPGDRTAAYQHDVAVWTSRAEDLLDAPSIRERADYWRNVCSNALEVHSVFSDQLKLVKPLQPQLGLKLWATLPAWPQVSSPLS